MTIRVGINGLGRIGRCVARAIYETGAKDIELVAVNGPAAVDTHVHLLKYDSVHGRFPFAVKAEGENLNINGKTVTLTRLKDPKQIPWGQMGVDLVLECTGKFNKKSEAIAHLEGGAKKVLVSAPAEEVDSTIVFGVNNAALKKGHQVVSVGSCTTNGLAPLAKVLHENFGIEHGFMTTVHSYTGDQNIVDASHKDLRRARAAALSIIPTSTGAAKTIGLILPELKGKLDGIALRVPTPNVSLIDLTFTAVRDVTKEEINAALEAAANGPLKGVLGVSKEPLVSIDFTGTTESSIADLSGTYVTGKRLVRVASWYDNEWAFSCRMLDVARLWS
ncbi:MAG: type I glyceraldehyde-3-phosphate dehydrogenase [Proteobacteria bacterium]|nr:type I glyceraldehyde-3-phosphate dehydrogenase [Pseudomonadota bacterium]